MRRTVCVLAAAAAAPAFAAPSSHTTLADYQNALGFAGWSVVGAAYDAAPAGTQIQNGDVFAGVQHHLEDSVYGGVLQILDNVNTVTPPHALGAYYAGAGYATGIVPSAVLTLTFAEPVRAFGAWFNTGDLDAGGIRIATDSGAEVFSGMAPYPAGYEYGQFAGIIDPAGFTVVTIQAARPGYTFTMDDFAFAVPTPGSAGLLAAAATVALPRRQARA